MVFYYVNVGLLLYIHFMYKVRNCTFYDIDVYNDIRLFILKCITILYKVDALYTLKYILYYVLFKIVLSMHIAHRHCTVLIINIFYFTVKNNKNC